MSELKMGTKCVQGGYTPGNGEPRQVPIIPVSYTHLTLPTIYSV